MATKLDKQLGELDDAQFEFLQTIAAFGSRQPSAAAIAKEYGYTRQWAWKHVERMRALGFVEPREPGMKTNSVRLTQNGKVLLEKALAMGHH